MASEIVDIRAQRQGSKRAKKTERNDVFHELYGADGAAQQPFLLFIVIQINVEIKSPCSPIEKEAASLI